MLLQRKTSWQTSSTPFLGSLKKFLGDFARFEKFLVSVSKSLNLFSTISFFHATRSGPQFNVLLEHNHPPHHLPHPVQQHLGGQLTAPSTDPRLIQDAFMQPPHHLPPQHHNTVRELATFLVKLFKPKVVLI